MDKLKIFINGTQDDLQPERQAVADAIRALGHEPVMAETYGAQPMPSLTAIREMIDRADIYIGVYGARYGWKMDGGVSVTEFEFTEFRRKHSDHILTYVKKCTPETEQAAFVNRVQDFKEGYFRRPFFTNEIELAEWVKQDLAQLITRKWYDIPGVVEPGAGKVYLEQVVSKPPHVFWTDQTYIHRNVTIKEDLFARTVARYDSLTPSGAPNSQPKLLEDVLQHEHKLVLLGEPGLGKTTSLRHLTWDTANRALKSPNGAEIPIYVELKSYDGTELEKLLARSVNEMLGSYSISLSSNLDESTLVLKTWLTQPNTRFLLLFDGLNEVRPEFQDSVRESLKSVLKSAHSVVISCREHDYDSSLREYTSAFVLQRLQEFEIRGYLLRTLGDNGIGLFETQIQQDWKMRTLAANPLMLQLISVVATMNNSQVQLPTNRGQLFQKFVTQMPRLRAGEVKLSKKPAVVESALANLGFEMQEREVVAADYIDVLNWQIPITGESLEGVLAQAKECRFLKSDGQLGERIEFLHQLFLEYFAADYIRRQEHSFRQKEKDCDYH